MARQCFNFWGARTDGVRTFQNKVCADSAIYRSIPGHAQGGANLIAVTDGVETIIGGSGYIFWDSPYALRGIEVLPLSDCPGCEPVVDKYDCINGTCELSSKYKTPGIYSDLSSCQSACTGGSGSNSCSAPNVCCPPPNVCVGTDYCPPNTKCLPMNEWNQIESLAAKNVQVHCR
jgi:hypothetical protein